MKVRSKNVWFILALLWVLIPFSARCEDPPTSIYGVLRRLIIETPGTATSIQEELVLIPPQGKALPLTLTNEIRSQLNKYVNSTVEIVSPDIKSKTKQAGASVVVSAFRVLKSAPSNMPPKATETVLRPTVLSVILHINQLRSVFTKESLAPLLQRGKSAKDTRQGPLVATVQEIMSEGSYGKLVPEFDKDGDGQPDILEVSITSESGCAGWDWADWPSRVGDLLTSQGNDPRGQYNKIVYLLPDFQALGCARGGWAMVYGIDAFVARPSQSIYAHELGHSFGFLHAGTDLNGDGALDLGGEYEDYSSIMGRASAGLNSINRVNMGWVDFQELSTPGTHEITLSDLDTPRERSLQQPQVLKVIPARGLPPLFLSIRSPSGAFGIIPQSFSSGVNIHRSVPTNLGVGFESLLVSRLEPNLTLQEQLTGIRITQRERIPGGIRVTVVIPASDSDRDGISDDQDPDDDNDGVTDTKDCSPNNAQRWRGDAFFDVDGDSIRDSATEYRVECFGQNPPPGYTVNKTGNDNCPLVVNQDQRDLDEDKIGDACDSDIDGDSVSNSQDCSPKDRARWRTQAYPDTDYDGVMDRPGLAYLPCFGQFAPRGYTLNSSRIDNCPFVSNPQQENTWGDLRGDACEPKPK